MYTKIRLIFIPLILVAISFTGLIYLFYRWLAVTNHLVFINDSSFIWGVMVAGIITIILLLRRRINLFKALKGSFNPYSGFYAVCGLVIIIPALIASLYVSFSTAKTTLLDDVSQIDSTQVTQYYKLKNYYVDKADAGYYYLTSGGGKHSYYDDIFIALPMYINRGDSMEPEYKVWLGINYDKMLTRKNMMITI